MSTIPSPIEQALPPSLNASLLREEARARVEQLAGARWTDYNTHDPGITILEALAYALTDLGVRARLEIPDLIAGRESHPFLTAREVLPAGPSTRSDFRRLLIDQPGIRNAWITSMPGAVKGTQSVLIDPESIWEDNLRIEINEVWLRGELPQNGQPPLEYYVVLPHWESLPSIWSEGPGLSAIVITQVKPALDTGIPLIDQFFVAADLTFGEGAGAITLEGAGFWVRLTLGVSIGQAGQIGDELQGALSNAAFFAMFQTRARERKKLLGTIRKVIHKHRNLGEDWGEISTVRVQQIGVKASNLELQPDADPEKVMAQICFALHRFITPSIESQNFEALLAQGRTAAEIFDGPLPEHGFISVEDLHQSQRQDLVYTSDIVRIIMEQESVIGVSGLTLDHYMDRIKVASNVDNCLRLRNTREYKPKFSFYDTHLKLFKRGVPISFDQDARERIRLCFENLLKDSPNSLPANNTDDLPVPAGDSSLDLSGFYSIQHEFPAIYGLRQGEILPSAPPLRKAQAKQLKAFLLLFEQLMANYCAQLAHLQDIFSLRPETDRTRFFQPLYDVPGVNDILVAFNKDPNKSEAYNQAQWNMFVQTPNAHFRKLEEIVEDRSGFLMRRNQFLDHLLGRFAEDFSDYTAWIYAQNGGSPTPDLVYDKLDFLNRFPELSSRRTQAFDYTNSENSGVWNTRNVSGYEKRVAALLGMPDYRRRKLGRLFNIIDHLEIYSQSGPPDAEVAHFRIRSAALNDPNPLSDQVVLSSKEKIPVLDITGFIEQQVALYSQEEQYYQFKPAAAASSMAFDLVNPAGEVLATRHQYFAGRGLCLAAIRDALHLFQGRLLEGMHLVEHVLLRADPSLQPVIFPGAGTEPFIEHPYAFQVSIFLPGWAPRFKNPGFRVVVEGVLRRELPAHIFPYIYWVELNGSQVPDEFIQFETAWQNWLEHPASDNLTQLVHAINMLTTSGHAKLAYQYKSFDTIV